MCSKACITFGAEQLSADEVRGRQVLDVGALDVNGSLRSVVEALAPASYTGVDMAAGPGVDVVCSAEGLLDTFGRESFDIVLSTEMLEHVRDWRLVVHNLKLLVRPGGTLLITTRSKGFPYHGYPYDFWRFEVEDMRQIFDDMTIDCVTGDPEDPGVFVKIHKPINFHEQTSADIALYSIVTLRRQENLTNAELRRFSRIFHVKHPRSALRNRVNAVRSLMPRY